uniref:Uncharacterized protein n=1 Tax=Rhizophora mucronata TaxID=61149 RepID=A0A2P2P6Z5_RHIMU
MAGHFIASHILIYFQFNVADKNIELVSCGPPYFHNNRIPLTSRTKPHPYVH